MSINVSPSQTMEIIDELEKKLWEKYSSYKKVELFVRKWIPLEWNDFAAENIPIFQVVKKEDKNIDLLATLHLFNPEVVLKMAIDLGIRIPDIIYSIPEIKGIMSDNYQQAFKTFEEAYKKVDSEPQVSITMANAALESIIKHICEDPGLSKCNSKDTLYKLTEHILREFKLHPSTKPRTSLRNIGSALLKIAQQIEQIRSEYSEASHGKTRDDPLFDDEIYSKLMINVVATVGLFLLNFYQKKHGQLDHI